MKFRIPVLVGAIVISAVVSACGGDAGAGNGGAPTVSATAPSERPTAGADTTLNVAARDFEFDKNELTASIGTAYTVVLENRGQAPHTFTVYEDDEYRTAVPGADTGQVAAGSSGQLAVTFSRAHVYHFRCDIHPTQMTGTIVVQ